MNPLTAEEPALGHEPCSSEQYARFLSMHVSWWEASLPLIRKALARKDAKMQEQVAKYRTGAKVDPRTTIRAGDKVLLK